MTTATATRSINWSGLAGRQYEYRIYPLGTNFKAAPGNYIFAKETSPGRHLPIYIGETEDLSERFDSHHKMPPDYVPSSSSEPVGPYSSK